LAAIAGPGLAAGAKNHTDIAALAKTLSGGETTVLRLLLPNGSEANVAPVTAEFTRLTGIQVAMNEVPVDEVNVQLVLDSLSGSRSHDVALPATFGLPDLVEAGAILPLSAMAGFADVEDLQDTSLYTIGDTFDGSTYGFQTDGDAYVMFYNNDILTADGEADAYADTFGATLDIPTTWDELDRQMEWFHRPDDGQCGGLLFRNPGYVAWEWWVRFHARGKWPLSPDMTPQIASDEGVAALEAMIRTSQFLAPEAATVGLFDNWDRYARGDIYANVGWGGSQKFFNKPGSALRGKLRYGTTPGGMVDGSLLVTPYFNWGWNYVALSGTPNPDLALLFAAFATSPAMSTLAVRQQDGFFDPFRSEHYDDAGIQSAYSVEFLEVHRQHGIRDPRSLPCPTRGLFAVAGHLDHPRPRRQRCP